MKTYRRARVPGGTYFFTLVTHSRHPWLLDDMPMQRLRAAFRKVMAARPFRLDAVVVLPDHMHAIWALPEGDADFSTRWRLIKHHVAVGVSNRWQPRFWEHVLRDDNDWRRHVDYIHYNPVKHGYVDAPSKWPHSSFRRAVNAGWYASDWGSGDVPGNLPVITGE